jgi:hypothetical protein
MTNSISIPTVFSVTSSTPFCSSTKTVLVNIYAPVSLLVSGPICSGITNVINYTATPPGGTLYVNGVQSNTIFPVITNTYNVSYYYQDTGSCVLNTSTIVTVNQTPCLKIAANNYTSCIGSQITFTGTPSGGTFSGGNISGNTLSLVTAGIHTVSYSYTDANNCSNSICTEVNSSLCADIPNFNLKRINIYPNPARNAVIIDNPNGGKILLKIYDLNGSLLYNSKLETTLNEINIIEYSSGLYIFYMESDTERKFIKVIKD